MAPAQQHARAVQIISLFHRNTEVIYFFEITQFRTENRFALFLELL